jgi:3-hydroxyisobutyrate dehydrogenase-like beta-hydroxyacid dehydrogenase
MPSTPTTLAFIGFGEAARAFVDSLRAGPALNLRAYDILIHGPEASALAAAAASRGVALVDSTRAAVSGADIVISAVTAGSAQDALVPGYADGLPPHVLFDINSVSVGVKQANAGVVRAAGGAYVDMAVMAPVHPHGHRTPVLVAGDLDGPAHDFLTRHGFDFEGLGPEPGQAAAVKMMRSLFVKGLEAITVQTLIAAGAAGCAPRVFESLTRSYPQFDLPKLADYFFQRLDQHGRRRAEELREVARTLEELGFGPGAELATGIAEVQARFAGSALQARPDLGTGR